MSYYSRHDGPSTWLPIPPATCISAYGLAHVCNNDTRLQQMNVKHNFPYPAWKPYYPGSFPELWKPNI